MGVFLARSNLRPLASRLPHRRGGVSTASSALSRFSGSSPQAWGCFPPGPLYAGFRRSSPQAWGCFSILRATRSPHWVFPTGVGVFPGKKDVSGKAISLPHRRGGVSMITSSQAFRKLSSPQAWGCFQKRNTKPERSDVFPTGVGVFPVKLWAYRLLVSLPHRRGGVSCVYLVKVFHCRSSPQAWGCFPRERVFLFRLFVFPTGVGVFPGGCT